METGERVINKLFGPGELLEKKYGGVFLVKFDDGQELTVSQLQHEDPLRVEKTSRKSHVREPGTYTWSNTLRAYVARLSMQKFPQLSGFFTTKELTLPGEEQAAKYEEAEDFLKDHPEFVALALHFKESGIEEIGISLLWEICRWDIKTTENVLLALHIRKTVLDKKEAEKAVQPI